MIVILLVETALPGKQFSDQGHQQHHRHSRAILGCTVAAVRCAGFAELRSDVGRRLGVDTAVRGSVHVFPGARTGNHHAIVNDLLHLLAHGPRLGLLLVEGIRPGTGWVAAVHEAPAALLLGDDVLREWVIAEGSRRSVRRTPPASQGIGLLKRRSQQECRHEQQNSVLGHGIPGVDVSHQQREAIITQIFKRVSNWNPISFLASHEVLFELVFTFARKQIETKNRST